MTIESYVEKSMREGNFEVSVHHSGTSIIMNHNDIPLGVYMSNVDNNENIKFVWEKYWEYKESEVSLIRDRDKAFHPFVYINLFLALIALLLLLL